MFKVGDLVALRSDPNIQFPVMQVIPGGAECRYRVFQNNAKNHLLRKPVAGCGRGGG